MKNLFSRIPRSIGGFLLVIHVIGIIIADFVFSYQYIKEYGLIAWLYLGEIVTTLKAVVWEIFLVLALIQSPSHTSTNPVLEQTYQDNLWISEYPALIKAVEQSDDNTLSTSYMTGPNLTSKVELYLSKKADNGLVLKTTLPREAILTFDPKTGEKRPSETPPVIIIRDHDLDGLPDDFHMEPSGTPLYKEKFSADGFIKYRDSPEHQVILLKWIIGIKYATNYFLHGVRLSIPR